LLAPDGRSIALPEMPSLVTGPDLLKEMNILPRTVQGVFFVGNYAYLDADDAIYELGFEKGEWKKLRKVRRVLHFNLREVVSCGDHDIATLVGAESARFAALDEKTRAGNDWLEQVGARSLFRKFGTPKAVTGNYGSCVFSLRDRSSPQWIFSGLARFDASGVQLFAFPDSEAALSDDEVQFSKDGCYALIHAFRPTPKVPEFTMPQQVELLRTQSPRCQ